MGVRLVDIEDVETEWESEHRVRCLVLNGRSPAIAALEDWKQNHKADYKKILHVIKLVAGNKRVRNEKHVKKADNFPVYEMRAHTGSARLFFFYTEGDGEVVVCTNEYWKAKKSKRKQGKAFGLCNDLRIIYEEHVKK